MPDLQARLTDVVLRDGSTVAIRPIQPDDETELLALFRSLSVPSRALRFFTAAPNLARVSREETMLRSDAGFGVVALAGPAAQIVGQASYRVAKGDHAEVAFAVAYTYQGRGLATLLLKRLAEEADGRGVRVFEAHVLPTNSKMLSVFRDSGFVLEVQAGPDEIRVAFPTRLTDEAVEQFERREQLAAVNALRAFFQPRAVAVIGASRSRSTPGGAAFHNLLAGEFNGPVYPVNPATEVVQSVLAYPSVEAIPGPVDLAVIAVPYDNVVKVVEQCARKGVRSVVVLSAGFGEVGVEGLARQTELLHACRSAGIRLIGPNCIGIANTDPMVRMNATFGPLPPPAGRVGFLSQSGALGLAAIEYAGMRGIGISSFISVGNKADISGNDLLNYWESDQRTDVILLYLESFGNPRKFARIARRVGKQKPIIAVKSGRSAAGARATSSHTGALLSASDVTVDALFHQAGVIRTDTLEELFDVATLLANQPLPAGRRVGIVTNAGGPAILCADACEAVGLEVPPLSKETQTRLRSFLSAMASFGNPVDMIAAATAEQYREAIAAVAADPGIDAVVALFIPPLATRPDAVARAVVEAHGLLADDKPILTVFMSADSAPAELRHGDFTIPSYAFPEPAAIALGHAVRYAEWRQRPIPAPSCVEPPRHDEAAALVASALGRGGGWLGPEEVHQLLACYGVPLVEERVANTVEEAAAAAAMLGGAAALKAIVPGLLHKTEAGLVRLNLTGAENVGRAATEMTTTLAAAGHPVPRFLVQRMAQAGVEMIVGLVHDPHFGPIVACGAGGVLVELLKDVEVRLAPLTREDAAEMIRGLKTYPLLTGYRGSSPVDVQGLEDILLRVSELAESLPQIAELDLNPVLVSPSGAIALDARIRVQEIGDVPVATGEGRNHASL